MGSMEDNYSLEDILAEYKGNAFIAGERKLTVEEMRSKAEKIIKEETGPSEDEKKPEILEFKPEKTKVHERPVSVEEDAKEIINASWAILRRRPEERAATLRPKISNIREVSRARAGRRSRGRRGAGGKPRLRVISGIFGRKKQEDPFDEELEAAEEEEEPEDEFEDESVDPDEEIPENEPNPKVVCKAYGAKARSLKKRCTVAAPICILMAYIVFAGDFGLPLPQVILSNSFILTVSLLGALLLVMALGYDVVWAGLRDLLRLKASAETLVTVSCIASIMDAASMVITEAFDKARRFCAVSACSMFLCHARCV